MRFKLKNISILIKLSHKARPLTDFQGRKLLIESKIFTQGNYGLFIGS